MWKSPEFWCAVIAAIIIKLRTSATLGFYGVISITAVSLTAAYAATDWVVSLTGAPEPICAGLVVLTAEGVMRWVLKMADDPTQAVEIWAKWRGKS